ncbi:putative membrane associated protein [Geobacillus sp. WSUCF1]|nr:putative membrane associated protein [Geobacillus sp. WSUCF1]
MGCLFRRISPPSGNGQRGGKRRRNEMKKESGNGFFLYFGKNSCLSSVLCVLLVIVRL